eukprot:7838543-Pyramimonas_sp.AAC.1
MTPRSPKQPTRNWPPGSAQRSAPPRPRRSRKSSRPPRARARAGHRGRRDAPANTQHSSQSLPHGFPRLTCGWAGGAIARAAEVAIPSSPTSTAPHRFSFLEKS